MAVTDEQFDALTAEVTLLENTINKLVTVAEVANLGNILEGGIRKIKKEQADFQLQVNKVTKLLNSLAARYGNLVKNEGELAQVINSIITPDELDALAGTSGTPSGANKFVTNDDPRMTDAREPLAHAASHEIGGTDVLLHENLQGIGTKSHATIDSDITSLSSSYSNIQPAVDAIVVELQEVEARIDASYKFEIDSTTSALAKQVYLGAATSAVANAIGVLKSDIVITGETSANANISITLVNDAVAGSESITEVDGTVTIHIESGVTMSSTIETLLEAFTYTAGTGSDVTFVVSVGSVVAVTVDGDATDTVTLTGGRDNGALGSDPVWRITRLTDNGLENVLIEYAGSGLYNQVWDDRASLTYA